MYIVEKFTPLIKKYSKKLNFDGADTDLIISLLNLIKSLPDNLIDDNVIVSYICVSIKNEYIRLSKRNNKFMKTEILFDGYITETPLSNDEESLVILNELLDKLPKNQSEVLKEIYIGAVQELFNKGIAVHVLNVGLLENTSMGKFFLITLLAVAVMERNTNIERTQTGKAIAKTKAGFKEGRPRSVTDTQINLALDLIRQGNSNSKVTEITRISKSTLMRAMRKIKLEGNTSPIIPIF